MSHLTLCSIHNTTKDRRCAMSHSNTPPVKKLGPLVTWYISLRWVSAAEHPPAKQYSKTGRTQPQKHLPRSNPSWNTHQDLIPEDSKPLRSCSGNREKMLLKSHLGIKCYSQYIMVIRFLQHSSNNIVNGGDWGCIFAWPGDYHCLSLTHSQLHPLKVTPLTDLENVTF